MLLEAALALEIQRTNPKVSRDLATVYAQEVVAQAARVDVDPWVFHGVIYVESRWTARVVRYEEDFTCSVGLGQINVRTCKKERVEELKNGMNNIAEMATFFVKIKAKCARRCGGLRWLVPYNPGQPRYVGWVKKIVDQAHARYDGPPEPAWPVPKVRTDLHLGWVWREETV